MILAIPPLTGACFQTRPANALRREGVRTWADLADLNDDEVQRMLNLGVVSVSQIRSVLASLDVLQLAAAAVPEETGEVHISGHTNSTVSRFLQDHLADFALLGQWGTACGADTIQALVDLLSGDHLPQGHRIRSP